MAGFKEAAGRSLSWAAKNVDGAIALVLAVAVGVLGVLPDSVLNDKVKVQLVSSSTLVVLALVATALLRDRVRQEPVEEAMNATSAALTGLPERLRRLDELEALVGDTRRALEDMSVVRVLGSQHEIAQAHADARRGTDRWTFKGGTGTYIRAVTLPECVAAARREKRHLTIRLEIIDPADEEVCESYAHYRRSLSDRPDGTGEVWTTDRARKESFATVLAAFWHRQRYGLLDIAVGLSSVMTTFRWDLSSHAVIMTVEDPNRAMTALAGTFYYESCDTELRTSLEQARRVPVDRYKTVPLSDEPTVEEVRRLFDRIDLPLPKSFTDRDVVQIARKALRAKDPYGS
ncbi:hypothetical protein [Microbispora sp. ATCC PTA-5024]|uniref:hypothetical protein n=1 Tax=Microbispora sp. ATCC PTA-5024 TaxID=316330 RepID=UPI0003DC5A40|nr:hypothetical protein [Microbispora sp. ATCC PTA-5024]ETK36523.1 hypothetical protein MPTA5024_08610 [Microbispora sp. ATCC PTA-5024]